MIVAKKKPSVKSPYRELFGTKDMGRGRPVVKGVHAGRTLPFVEGGTVVLRRKAMGRVLKILKYNHWTEFVALYEAEMRYLVSEEKRNKEDDSDG